MLCILEHKQDPYQLHNDNISQKWEMTWIKEEEQVSKSQGNEQSFEE